MMKLHWCKIFIYFFNIYENYFFRIHHCIKFIRTYNLRITSINPTGMNGIQFFWIQLMIAQKQSKSIKPTYLLLSKKHQNSINITCYQQNTFYLDELSLSDEKCDEFFTQQWFVNRRTYSCLSNKVEFQKCVKYILQRFFDTNITS